MIKGGKGGANTQTGLHFEAKADIRQIFEAIPGYNLKPQPTMQVMKFGFMKNYWLIVLKSRNFIDF